MEIINQGQDVTVELQTIVEQENQQEKFSFNEPGNLVTMGDAHYLRYKELQDGIETPVTFKFSEDGSVVLTRHSENRSHFTFMTGKSVETHYQSAYGMMTLQVQTNRLEAEFDYNLANGTLLVDYELKSADNVLGKYQIRLHFFK